MESNTQNKDWINISSEFTEELQKEWESKGFSYEECKDWINIGLGVSDADFAQWLKNTKKVDANWILDHGNSEQLRNQYTDYLSKKHANELFADNFEFTFSLNTQEEKKFNDNFAKLNLNNNPSWLEGLSNYSQSSSTSERVHNMSLGLNLEQVEPVSSLRQRKFVLPKSKKKQKERVLEKTNSHPNWKEYGNPFLDFTKEVTQIWIELGFSKESCQEWLNIGLKAEDVLYAYWLKNVKEKNPEWVLNYNDKTSLREEFVSWFKVLRKENISTQWLNENYPKEHRASIKKLDVTEKNLEGNLDLSDFANLEELYCNKNAFSHLDITKCNNLRILNCSNNQLAELDVSNLTKLSILECWNNQIKSLNLENCLQLSYLDCNNNLITDLNINNFPVINSVNCYANKLTNFQINNCPQLECLYFSDNLLTDFDFTSLNPEKVTTLHLGNNKFIEQDLSCFSQFTDLLFLSIGVNRFTGSLEPLQKCSKLRALEICNNDIESGLEYLPKSIKAICCSTKEETKEVGEIEQLLSESDDFILVDNAGGTGKLYIRKEEWKNIDSSFTPELQKDWEKCGFDYDQTKSWINAGLKVNDFIFAFCLKECQGWIPEKIANYDNEDIYKLRKSTLKLIKSLEDSTENAQEWLDKEYPKNGTCLGEFDKINKGKKREEIKELNIKTSDEKKLEGNLKLERFVNLEKLDCSGNSIVGLDLSDCTKLNELRCFSNHLTSLELNNCSNLTQLWCSNNHFANLDVGKYTNLRVLDCGNNQLTSLEVSNLVNLITLECPDNFLDNLDLSNCRKIFYLSCYENRLKKLDVSSLDKIEFLYCSNNKLNYLELGQPNRLSSLSCSENSLSNVEFISKLPNPQSLEELNIGKNDFPTQDLSIFSRFANLRILCLDNNRFHDSLKFLEKLDKLQELYIDNTDIDKGVEFLSDSLEYFSFSGCSKIEEADKKNSRKYSRKNERKQAMKNATSLIFNYAFSEESKSKPEAIPSEELEKIINKKVNIKGEIIDKQFFSTWFNPNCAIIINKVYGYAIRLIIYEPPLEKIEENLFVKRFPKNPLKWYSLEKAQKKVELIKEKLNSDNPILAVAKKSSSLSDTIQKVILPYNIDPKEHLRPLDIIWRKMDDGINYHAAIYLGDNQAEDNAKVAHISFLEADEEKGKKKNIRTAIINTVNSKKYFWARIDTWERFLKGTNNNLIKHHLVIPFKQTNKINMHISKAVFHQHGRGLYDLLSNNCEHFATLCVCSIPFSEQADRFNFLFSVDLVEELRKSDEMFEKEMINMRSLFWELQFGSTISDFKASPELVKEWTKAGFINEQVRKWLDAGLKIQDYGYAKWLKETVQLNPEQVSFGNNEKTLRKQFEEHQTKHNPESFLERKKTETLMSKVKKVLLTTSETELPKKAVRKNKEKNDQSQSVTKDNSRANIELLQKDNELVCQQCWEWLNTSLLTWDNRPQQLYYFWLKNVKQMEKEKLASLSNYYDSSIELRIEYHVWCRQLQPQVQTPPKQETQQDWTNLHFSFTPELIQSWQSLNFTYQQTQSWLNIGLSPTYYKLCSWLRDAKNLTPEQVLNHSNLEQLNQEFFNWQKKAQIEQPPK